MLRPRTIFRPGVQTGPQIKKGASDAPFNPVAGSPGDACIDYLGSGGRVRISFDAFAVMVL
jgi:hypothetical protein